MKVPTSRIWVLGISAMLLALGACSGNDSGDKDGPAPLPTTGVLSTGVVTGFGSVYVDGVRYETSGAEVTMDGEIATPAQLRVGQYVEVKGHAQGDQRHADVIRYHNVLEGPVSSVDVAGSSFVAMGQTVLVTSATSLGEVIQPQTIEGIAVGDVVEVSGMVPLTGAVEATRVDVKPDGGPYEVTGYVAALDVNAKVFGINDLVVDYSTANMEDFPTGAPAEGDLVLVKGFDFLPLGEFLAIHVELRSDDCLKPDPGDLVEVEGLVSDFVSATDFMVAGTEVTTTAATLYEHGTVADLADGVLVYVKGTTDTSGVLVANKIAFRIVSTVRIVAQVQAIDTDSITLLGLDVATDEFTRYEDDSVLDLREFDRGDIAVGDWLDLRGYEESEGSNLVVATRVVRIDPAEEVRLRGPFLDAAPPGFAILSIAVSTTGDTKFRLEDLEDDRGEVLTPDQFFYLAGGEIVEAWGTWNGAALVADRVEIKVCDD